MSDYSLQQVYKKINIDSVPLMRRVSDPIPTYYKYY